MVGTLKRADVFVLAAEHVGGGRQQLEVRRFQRTLQVGGRERFIGTLPRVRRIELAASLTILDRVHATEC